MESYFEKVLKKAAKELGIELAKLIGNKIVQTAERLKETEVTRWEEKPIKNIKPFQYAMTYDEIEKNLLKKTDKQDPN